MSECRGLFFALFVRTQDKLTPNPDAYFFLEECEEIFSQVERTKRTLQRISSLQAGKLHIACHPAAPSMLLPRLMTQFLKGRDELNVSLIMRSSDLIEELIASQQFDAGFAETLPRARQSGKTD